MTLHATWLGQATVIGTATDSPDVIIPLNQVASAPAAQAITLPFDTTLALPANQTSLFSFTTDGLKPVNIVVAAGQGSTFIGQARLLQGSTVLATATLEIGRASC